MVNSSKILTVSYGTFSCTLEGFDDSFDTMKAIAEYFRDLAADDRYFGAEPPTPDADMLARIAEREIARRVEAHEDHGKIVLRASEPVNVGVVPQVTAPPAESTEFEQQPVEIVPVAETPIAETPTTVSVIDETSATASVTQDEDRVSDTAPSIPEEDTAATEDEPVIADEELAVQQDEVETTAFVTAEDLPAETAPDLPETEDVAADPETPAEEPAPLFVEPEVEALTDDVDVLLAEDVEADEAVAIELSAENEAEDEPPLLLDTPIERELTADEDVSEPPVSEQADALAEEIAESEAYAIEDFEPVSDEMAEDEAFFAYTAPIFETPVPHPDPDSVAAKLSRIRSVVSDTPEPFEDTDYNEDEHAQDFLSNAAADLDAALAEDDAAELQDVSEEALPELPAAEIPVTGLAESAEESAEDTDPSDQEESVETDVEEFALQDTLTQLLADAIPQDATAETADTGGMVEAECIDNATDANDVPEVASDEEIVPDEDGEAGRPLNARVIKMKRRDFEAAVADGLLEEELDDEEPINVFGEDEVAEDQDDQLLSPEDEEDLQRELAEVEAELELDEDAVPQDQSESDPETEDAFETGIDVPREPSEEIEAEPASDLSEATETVMDPPEAAAVEGETPETAEEALEETAGEGRRKFGQTSEPTDLERIFDETDTQLDAPESSQRRSAIQHLRAAVAATRAEKKAGAELQKDVDDAPYRTDLANVVRPRRPSAAEGTRSERPTESRPAPLKLVAEQRIDTPREPIRPRRVSTGEIAAETAPSAQSEGNFSDFAKQMGATRLPDMLEAAAAYLSDVEGRPQFSRPMLMQKLQEFQEDNFSREDGLRSFGQLLRQGKLQKLKGGRFAVTDETEFRVETRHAG